MKILILAPSYPSDNDPYGGIFIHQQVKAIKRSNQNVTIDVIRVIPFAPKILKFVNRKYLKYENLVGEYLYDGVRVSLIKVFTLPRNLNTSSMCKMLYKKFKKILSDTNYDIVHAHGAVHTGYAAVRACTEKGIKSVVTVHGSDIMYYSNLNNQMKEISNYIFKNADSILAVSNGLKKVINDKNPETRVEVLYTGIDLSKFNIINNENKNKKTTKIGFIFVGNLLQSKGINDLINAFSKLIAKGYECKLTFCGTGDQLRVLKRICNELNLEQISFLGAVENDKLPDVLADHDILVLPSHREGLGTVLIEALAMGKLVIGASVGGIPEIINNEINGYLFETENVSDLYKKMEIAMTSYENFDPYLLRETVKNKFCVDLNSKRLNAIYNKLVSN
ncbi:MAG: glycosyltransferase [Halanaerobiales bacterium]|nr:glycosyltransferase [Halanaerobiales bacterium]